MTPSDASEQNSSSLSDFQKLEIEHEHDLRRIQEEARLKKLQSQVDAESQAVAAERAAKYAMEKAKWDTERELHEAYHNAILEQAAAGFTRARQGSEFVEKAAAAIGAIYASLLGLVFVAGTNPLPSRGAIPAIFLGLAIALAAAYLAFLKKAEQVPGRRPGSNLRVTQENRSFSFEQWVRAGVMSRRYAARAAVIALAVAVMFLPAPFVGTSNADSSIGFPTDQPVPDKDIDDPNQRQQRYDIDLEIYRSQALAAIAQLSAEPTGDAEEASRDSADLVSWIAAAIGLVAVLGLPVLYEWQERKRSSAP